MASFGMPGVIIFAILIFNGDEFIELRHWGEY